MRLAPGRRPKASSERTRVRLGRTAAAHYGDLGTERQSGLSGFLVSLDPRQRTNARPMWPVRLRAAGLRKRTKAALPGRKRGNAVVIWSLNLLGIFLHSILRHAVVGFRHAFLRLVLLLHCLGICVRRVVGLRGLLSSRAGDLGGGNRYASHKSRTAYRAGSGNLNRAISGVSA